MRIIIEPNKLLNGRRSKLDPWRARLADHMHTLAYGETKTAAKQAAEQALVSAYIGTCTTPVVRLASDRSIFVGDAISEREVRISHFYCDDDGNPIDGKCSVSFAECVCSHPALVAEVERAERSYSEAIPVNKRRTLSGSGDPLNSAVGSRRVRSAVRVAASLLGMSDTEIAG
jgi:hypothetical protein